MRKAYRSLSELTARLRALDYNETEFTVENLLQAVNKVFSLSEDSGFYGAWLDGAKVVFAFDEREMSARTIDVLISKRLEREADIKNCIMTSKPYLPEGRIDSIKYVDIAIRS